MISANTEVSYFICRVRSRREESRTPPPRRGRAPLFPEVKPCQQARPRGRRRRRLRNAHVRPLQSGCPHGRGGETRGTASKQLLRPTHASATRVQRSARRRRGERVASLQARSARGHSAALRDSPPQRSWLPRERRGQGGGPGALRGLGLLRVPLSFSCTGEVVHEGSRQRRSRRAAARGGTREERPGPFAVLPGHAVAPSVPSPGGHACVPRGGAGFPRAARHGSR